jgi:beta-galactosidase
MNTYSPTHNTFAAQFDVKGWNYALDYARVHKENPDWAIVESETQSTISSRGFYDLEAIPKVHYLRENNQCSSYALEYPGWANTPDIGFATLDDNPFIAGEFVWTGFDYLGEPTPYDTKWPSRSSYFGLVDFAGMPKDIYYMYQARWTNKDVLHVLPHWNWEKGQNVPVHVFTSYNSAELFVNGISQGVRTKDPSKVYNRYRLVWDSVKYEPGNLKVIAFDEHGKACKEAVIETAGEPYKIIIVSDTVKVKANGKDLAYFEVQVVDKQGRLCPQASNKIHFEVEGNGKFRAASNGDATNLEAFHLQNRNCFYGKCVAIVQTSDKAGEIVLKASSEDLVGAEVKIIIEK